MNMSQHANLRSQQRAISPMLVDLLIQFGTSEPAGNGASKVFFDKAARRRVKSYAGPLAGLLNEYLDVYAVISSEDRVITAAHLTERIRRH
jgi:hypothetical protein